MTGSHPRTDFAAAVFAVSTLFLLSRDAQRSAMQAAARHLRAGGALFEAFRPDPSRFDRDGRRVESRRSSVGSHVAYSTHDPLRRLISIEHQLTDDSAISTYVVTLHYASEAELDAVAADAGLTLAARWHDWTPAPARPDSTDPISVYRN